MGDINVDTTEAEQAKLANRLLKELYITHDLSNLVTESTCTPYTHQSSIDVILTNRKQNFMLSKAVETGLSDFHKMVTAFMRNTYSCQEPIKIYYCNYSNFDKTKFIEDFEKSNKGLVIKYGGGGGGGGSGPAERRGGSSIFKLMKRGGSPKYWSCL